MIGRNEFCWCGSQKKWKKCHFPIEPPYADHERLSREYFNKYKILIKQPDQIIKIRNACRLARHILELTAEKAKVGVTTNELDSYAAKLIKDFNAIAAPLHYGRPPYPKSICTSINDVICHGIPNDKPLQDGDIMNIDVSVILDGFYGDCSKMVLIGNVPQERRHVSEVAYECLHRAIKILKPGVLLYEIGDVIEDYATSQRCSVVNQFVGHGVGIAFHEPPQVPHHRNHVKIPLVAGMTFTIEPMINAGVREAVIDPVNEWEARTRDKKPSAQWEHTILITEEGYEILTVQDK